MKAITNSALSLLLFFTISCNSNDDNNEATNPLPTDPETREIKYLALGDSYTIGQSVCETCRFPEQLKAALSTQIEADYTLKIVAQTGWTTTNLKNAIAAQNPSHDYDLVTLLIGVNNQYQGMPFETYEQEFPELVNTAIMLAKGDKQHVIIVSIPDYAYTPFGQSTGDPGQISYEIDRYNNFALNYATANGIQFVNITDITREGIFNPELVTSDGLHPSQSAYAKFVERLLPKATSILE
ncbi:SGNH/GDSL hydrolase family protein [Flavobacterium pallidum]|uniref:Lysophospholipase n=1 Tax=Flavobacterium pallidum TaxID=2172098 RepID=A0A2S1SEA7_9FLAO|nr:SGNH/GDSL hydrolase family protein [Flavobacterium pallidum]AWI24763.1 lysophospholipase [Flavobacterium pallidum]